MCQFRYTGPPMLDRLTLRSSANKRIRIILSGMRRIGKCRHFGQQTSYFKFTKRYYSLIIQYTMMQKTYGSCEYAFGRIRDYTKDDLTVESICDDVFEHFRPRTNGKIFTTTMSGYFAKLNNDIAEHQDDSSKISVHLNSKFVNYNALALNAAVILHAGAGAAVALWGSTERVGNAIPGQLLEQVQGHDHHQDAVCDHHDEHGGMRCTPIHVVDLSCSIIRVLHELNMTPYDQYVKDNAVPVVQNNASMVPNDAYVMIDNDVHESDVLSVSHTPRNTVVNNLLNAKLATYKEQVELYERRARKRIEKGIHSVKLQLCLTTIQHNKLMVDEVTSLKKDFNQKENKYLEEFLDLKALKDKVEDKLFKQGQSIQTVHMMCKPRSYYDEVNKVAIGYKNPLSDSTCWEETLEQSEISRKKMHDKMKANECVDNKMKAEALKEQNTRPIKALTVYPPNTPATLVPRVLPTKSQVKINIFTLRQLFSEFEKTCKKRITPTGITEGERGFEQTKTCLPHELEAELDQSIVDRKHDEIERKNLLIEHDNIIADGLSKEVFYVALNSELNVSRFTEMQKAHNVVKARCLELEAELSNLRDNVRSSSKTYDGGGRSRLMNFMKKFIGTVRFGNDHFGAIMGYGDYVVDESVISRVYYVEGLGNNMFSVGQFYDSDLEVAFRKHSCYVRDTDEIELVEAARTMLIFSKAPMFLWAEAMATACYTQNRSLIHTRHDKTPYELVHNKKPDLTFFRVFGALCYLTNDSQQYLGIIQQGPDIRIFIGYAPSRKGLVPNPAPAIPYVPPTNKELELLFQPMFDEYFNPPVIRQDPIPNVVQDPVITTVPSVSISVNPGAPSGSHISSPLDHHSTSVHHGIAVEQYAEVNPLAAADPEPFINVFVPDPTFEASSSGEITIPEPNQSTLPHEHIRKWT
ncbi:retrovirus-related pol polyprotein from transposon TNT 1-94 [Tanacetum coccineum]